MFTGIVTALGRIVETTPLGHDAGHGRRLVVEAPLSFLEDVGLGDSIALNGACMTVTTLAASAGRFGVDISIESLARTAGLDELRPVNLEKALRGHDRLGGHLVSGHVDGVGTVVELVEVGESSKLTIVAPPALARFIAVKGSITVDGVSLTVNRVVDRERKCGGDGEGEGGCEISINLVPHTLAHTTLGGLHGGAKVNLEVDLIARYVERMLASSGTSNDARGRG